MGNHIIIDSWTADSDRYFEGVSDTCAILEKDPAKGFPKAVWENLRRYLLDLEGKRVCVPSCGDNIAVFAFHLLGAKVTATDLVPRQIENAKRIAESKGWDIKYHVNDSMTLEDVADDAYDLVYTSNGVHVWIDDLEAMYRNIHRVLKPGGYSVMFDTYPGCRPFCGEPVDGNLRIRKPDWMVGPFEDGTWAWRTQDLVNAVLSSGLCLRHLEEFHSAPEDLKDHNYLWDDGDAPDLDRYDWEKNPWAAIPQCLALYSQKILARNP